MSRLVKVPSGTVIDLDRVVFFATDTKAIGKYIAVIENLPTLPILDASDMDALVTNGHIQILAALPLVKA